MLQEVIDEYIASLSLKEQERGGTNQNTVVAYRNDLNQVCSYLKRQQIENWQQVTHEHIAGYLLEMRDDQAYRPASIARKLAALKTFFRYLQSTGIITSDPIEKLDTPRIQRELPHVLTQEQIANLFCQVDVETPAGKRDFAMLHMLYATGMRVSELISLNLSDFDVEHATIVCPGRNGRSRRERVLPLYAAAVEATKRYLETARTGLIARHPEEQALVLNHHGERLTRQGFWLIIKGDVGVILGSGLGHLAVEVQDATAIPYEEIPHFLRSTVVGHAGRLLIGKLENVPVVVMQGRFHFYEGYTMQALTLPVRVMSMLGAQTLIVTNAAGGI